MSLTRTLMLTAVAAALSSAAFAQAPASPPEAAAAAPAANLIAPNPSADIVANLKASGHFTTLLKALDATNLTALLQSSGRQFTLFAPTDEAFAALPAGTLENWMKPDNAAQFQRAVAYHVVATKVALTQVKGAKGPVPSAIGAPLQVDGSGDPILVNDAKVLQADVGASNGSIYVIDKVLTVPAS
jgi:uncharacterized surface protein with fasciclin (FAS1) repeats